MTRINFSDCDCLIVGAGLSGAVIAERLANVAGKKVVLLECRDHLGGNCHSCIDPVTGIEYHAYGTHIFHTSHPDVWDYVKQFTAFNGYYHQVLTTYQNKVYQMPINLETVNSFYNRNLKPYEVEEFLAQERAKDIIIRNPTNFEEKAISLLGRPLYEAFIRGYTIKQWQKDPKELPAAILNRLPFRTNYNENYFHDTWQGVPEQGYAPLFNKMLANPNIFIHLNTDFFTVRDSLPKTLPIVYTGPIDRFFNYQFGALTWRTLVFEREIVPVGDYQGTSVMNYAEEKIPFTRIHEPRHLHPERSYRTDKTLIIREYSRDDDGRRPYYPVNDAENQRLLRQYQQEAEKYPHVIFAGRLGEYTYLDMGRAMKRALDLFEARLRHL